MTASDLSAARAEGGDPVEDAVPGVRRRRRAGAAAGVVALALLGVVGTSVGRALTAPGTDSTSARLAEWARGHGMSGLIDRAERLAYRPPRAGGVPAAGSPLEAPGESATVARAGAALAPVVPPASPALPGEGAWHPVVQLQGRPALQEAFVRPDATHTSYTAGLAWMDPSLLRFVLHPGTEEPGHGPWSQPPALPDTDRSGLVAAFNGGFRLDAASGGYFADGRTVGGLRTGAASLVITADGRAEVAQWGRDAAPGPDVVAVRQNLDLIVDGGQPVAGLDSNAGHRWGATLGNRLYVFRSGIGQTAAGDLVYVAGDRLSAATLADLLRRAGAVRAMELDINPEWTSFVDYPSPSSPGVTKETNLLPDMQRKPTRYDTTGTRDFVAVVSR